MKMFVWVDPYHVKYGSTMVIAVAETEAEARELAKRGVSCGYGTPGGIDAPLSLELGEPHRVIECPCAEWHYWAE